MNLVDRVAEELNTYFGVRRIILDYMVGASGSEDKKHHFYRHLILRPFAEITAVCETLYTFSRQPRQATQEGQDFSEESVQGDYNYRPIDF